MSGWWLASYLLLWLLVLATIVVLLVVLRQLGLIYLRALQGGMQLDEGPPIGTPLRFDEMDVDGELVRFPFPDGRLNLLLFTTPGCSLCKEALRGLSAMLGHYNVSAVVIDAGSSDETSSLRALAGEGASLVSSLRLQRKIGVGTKPYALVADREGVIVRKGVVNHIDDIEDLIDHAEKPVQSVPA